MRTLTPDEWNGAMQEHRLWRETRNWQPSGARMVLAHVDVAATLRNAGTTDVDLSSAVFDQCSFRGMECRIIANEVHFHSCTFENANLRFSTFRNATFWGGTLQLAKLYRAEFDYATLRDVYMQHADLRETTFREAILRCVDMRAADLSRAKFSPLCLSQCTLTDVNLRRAALPSPPVLLAAAWGDLPEELTADMMAYDAASHPEPWLFDAWASVPNPPADWPSNKSWDHFSGRCPYEQQGYEPGVTQRPALFHESRTAWRAHVQSVRGAPRPFDLMVAVLKAKCFASPFHEPEPLADATYGIGEPIVVKPHEVGDAVCDTCRRGGNEPCEFGARQKRRAMMRDLVRKRWGDRERERLAEAREREEKEQARARTLRMKECEECKQKTFDPQEGVCTDEECGWDPLDFEGEGSVEEDWEEE